MNLSELFTLQKALDEHILTENGLHGQDLVQKKILALQVELGELANETRCFKFWSKKPASPALVVLEEYVDALHFVLGLGLDHGFTDVQVRAEESTAELTEQFLYLHAKTCLFAESRSEKDYVALFDALLTLGVSLGFSEAEIENAYLAKNQVNHKRQEQGY